MVQEKTTTQLHEQLPADVLIKQTLERGEGQLCDLGAICVTTGKFTGRSPEDKFIVNDEIASSAVDWNKFNQPIDEIYFLNLKRKIENYLQSLPEIWERKMLVCADPSYRVSVRVITETPWANLFAANLFIEPDKEELETLNSDWTVIQAPGFEAEPAIDGTRQANFSVISFKYRTILIGGSAYTGEIKKGMFSVLNFLLPQKNILTMHCSANEGQKGDVALFFGLSGTGKTTLSADPSRKLIGDDEHGWSEKGVFNFEGGCYAKIVNLSEKYEPQIYRALKSGALIENILPGKDNALDFSDCSITENTRASYPLNFIANAKHPSTGNHPKHIFFLSCDAYGVLPPISRLNRSQAIYYFLNGYTAKTAGTEVGVTEPKVTFSTCFGAPFLPLHAMTYAHLLAEKMDSKQVKIWLINTGWTGGPYGIGKRINLAYTRAMINAVLEDKLKEDYRQHPVFNLSMLKDCPGVPSKILDPVKTWSDHSAYEAKANHLAFLFDQNYAKYHSNNQAGV
jgi:phosphoenolpyruvate carboxykinase (ATP)